MLVEEEADEVVDGVAGVVLASVVGVGVAGDVVVMGVVDTVQSESAEPKPSGHATLDMPMPSYSPRWNASNVQRE